MTHADVDADELVYARAKDKSDKALEICKFFVNALYVALTRAVETVYVVESDTTRPLLGLLRLPILDDRGFDELHAKVFAPASVYYKAKQQLWEFDAFHGISALGRGIETRTSFAPPKRLADAAPSIRDRFLRCTAIAIGAA